MMTTEEIANRLVELMRKGDYDTCFSELFSQDVINMEPEGSPWGVVKGIEAIKKKGEEYGKLVEQVHSSEISDPLVAKNFITLVMKMRVTFKGATEPFDNDEVCVYEVQDGKIVKEMFFYTPQNFA